MCLGLFTDCFVQWSSRDVVTCPRAHGYRDLEVAAWPSSVQDHATHIDVTRLDRAQAQHITDLTTAADVELVAVSGRSSRRCGRRATTVPSSSSRRAPCWDARRTPRSRARPAHTSIWHHCSPAVRRRDLAPAGADPPVPIGGRRRCGPPCSQLELAVDEPSADLPELEVVVAGLRPQQHERVAGLHAVALGQHALRLLDDDPAVQRALQLL